MMTLNLPTSCLLFVLMSISTFASSEPLDEKITITVAAIDWCPQICSDNTHQGYVVDLVEEAFKGTKYQLDIQIYPWSRAIKLVSSGKVDALLSPAKAEAPNLLYPTMEVGNQQMCFFTSINSDWLYSGIKSLQGKQIGIATDTSIEELNDYVKHNPEQFQYQPYHERYIIQNAHKLDKQRIDSFLFTKNSTIYELKKYNKRDKYRLAGCVSQEKIYLAFTPSKSTTKDIIDMMTIFDEQVKALHKTPFISHLMAKYGLAEQSL